MSPLTGCCCTIRLCRRIGKINTTKKEAYIKGRTTQEFIFLHLLGSDYKKSASLVGCLKIMDRFLDVLFNYRKDIIRVKYNNSTKRDVNTNNINGRNVRSNIRWIKDDLFY
jgi:hypothetical protein